ncbi:hypothetical protein THASP1DRAFT_23123 [Thamnocephalis sphaerospora]|uniref:BHLH domain-containing protein n=1 Tax=Thamnocephalis sphaerospora TaxID=78915 RepID=A0A4V1IWW5_9FUNG|nr:hypothetical protein THASP1DRAFT_23123 [Thamnocephalis sphaerospora]|eukprot:RKP08979.1 hypothetical protein THASP1DRAFT_23123 [Thamnocephalis sphaerospora]
MQSYPSHYSHSPYHPQPQADTFLASPAVPQHHNQQHLTSTKGGMPSPPTDSARASSPYQRIAHQHHSLSPAAGSRESSVGMPRYDDAALHQRHSGHTTPYYRQPAQHMPPYPSSQHSAYPYESSMQEMHRRLPAHGHAGAPTPTPTTSHSRAYEQLGYAREHAPSYGHPGVQPASYTSPAPPVHHPTAENAAMAPRPTHGHQPVHADHPAHYPPAPTRHSPQYAPHTLQAHRVHPKPQVHAPHERDHPTFCHSQAPSQPARRPSAPAIQPGIVSYAGTSMQTVAPNHSGNIVFSVGVAAAGSRASHTTSAGVTGASVGTGVGTPPATTMASQISKFRAMRRIVDKRDHQRRVSHSAIERRRRERINSKMSQLRRLVPSCRGQDHLHKLSVLQGAIEYIHELRRELGIKDEASELDPFLNPAAADDADLDEDMDGDVIEPESNCGSPTGTPGVSRSVASSPTPTSRKLDEAASLSATEPNSQAEGRTHSDSDGRTDESSASPRPKMSVSGLLS